MTRTEQRLVLIEVTKPVHDEPLVECLIVLDDADTGTHVATARAVGPVGMNDGQLQRLARRQLLHNLAERWGLTR